MWENFDGAQSILVYIEEARNGKIVPVETYNAD